MANQIIETGKVAHRGPYEPSVNGIFYPEQLQKFKTGRYRNYNKTADGKYHIEGDVENTEMTQHEVDMEKASDFGKPFPVLAPVPPVPVPVPAVLPVDKEPYKRAADIHPSETATGPTKLSPPPNTSKSISHDNKSTSGQQLTDADMEKGFANQPTQEGSDQQLTNKDMEKGFDQQDDKKSHKGGFFGSGKNKNKGK